MTVFPSALPASPLQDNRQCGVYNSAYEGHWQSLSCESALPYICKKTPNNTRRAEPLGESICAHTHTRDTHKHCGDTWRANCFLASTEVSWLWQGWIMNHSAKFPRNLNSCARPKQCLLSIWVVKSVCFWSFLFWFLLLSSPDASSSYRELAVYPYRVC